MDRRTVAQSFSTAVALPLALHAEAEAELSTAREEVAQLRAALAQEKAGRAADREVALAEMRDRLSANKAEFDAHEREVADYEQTVAGLRERLREEEARRASYQAVDSAARRFVERFRQENPRSGWQAGWRCPVPEMHALLEAVDPDESRRDPVFCRGA